MGVTESVMAALSGVAVNYTNAAFEAILTIIVAGVFIIIGYVIAKIINLVLASLFDKIELQKALKKKKLDKLLAGYSITKVVTAIIAIYVPLMFLAQATTIRNLGVFTDVITWVLWYIPNLLAGLIVLISALLFAEYLSNIIAKETKMQVAKAAGKIVQVFIAYVAVVFTLPMILPGADVTILQEAFRWLVMATSIAFGLGFAIAVGWGFKDAFSAAAKKNQRVFDDLFNEVRK